MLLAGIALGLIAGLLAGGRLGNLASVHLRWPTLLFLAVILRFGTELALSRGLGLADALRLPLFAAAYGLLAFALWENRRLPGLALALVGIALNGTVTVVNGGYMPVWGPSLTAAGLTQADITSPYHLLIEPTSANSAIDASFLAHLGPLADVIPIPVPVLTNVISIGDLFLAFGLAFFLFATVLRPPEEETEPSAGSLAGLALAARLPRSLTPLLEHGQVRPETGLAAGVAEAAALERPLVLAGAGAGLAAPALAPIGIEGGPAGVVAPRPVPGIIERARRHPYVRLALNGPFSAMWTGQLISLFGDRVNQLALAFLVLQMTDSPLAVGLVFVAATLPNLVLGPIAGTLVDRWDQKQVMIVSDLLRAAAVLLIPIAAVTSLPLVYPLVFLVTAISIFFRPARTAVLPRIVRPDELVTANSATWLGETLADVIGYPLAGLFVASLGASVPLAFWFDAATYIASALLIASVFIPPLTRESPVAEGIRGVIDDLVAGWRFLRHETVLLANTLQGVAGQFTAGLMLTLTPIFARDILAHGAESWSTDYGLMETAIGLGNLIGGFVIGLIGARLAKGRLVIFGYAAYGLCIAALALAGELPLAFGLLLGGGIANMVYIIPSQTLFQERAPADMIGRVVGFRFAAVFGAMTLAMGVAGIGAQLLGVVPVVVAGGLLTFVAGVAGWFVPAVRDA